MGVEREEVRSFSFAGKAVPVKLSRQANGDWFVEFAIDMEMRLRDGREIIISKTISTRANQQIGRRCSVQPNPAQVSK